MSQEHILSTKELITLVENMLALAMQQPGVTNVEVAGSTSVGLTTKVRMGETEVIEFNRDKSIGLTVYKDKRTGSASITDLTQVSIVSAIQAACRIAEYTEPDPYSGLAAKDQLATNVPDLDLYHPTNISPEEAIINAKECEAAALSYSKEITNSDGAAFSTNDQLYVYGNTEGFISSYQTTKFSAYCVMIGQRGSSMQRDYDFTVARDIHDLTSLTTIGKKAAEKVTARLGARKLDTCQAPVIFAPKIATGFWGTLVSAISGGNLFRKSSFLVDTLNQKIFPDFINITEQPHILKGLGSAPFDDDGVATKYKEIIKNGILNSYLLSTYSARQLGMQTTGNAGGIHNVFVAPGKDDLSGMLKNMQRGLLVTELLGHGTNIITGDYSHGAAGFWIENGAIAYPVEEITIAGNLRDMFTNIVAVGNDLDYRSNIITGSVFLERMTIAGN